MKVRIPAAFVVGIAVLFFSTTIQAKQSKLYYTWWVSEEHGGPPTLCRGWDEAAVGFGCRGRYCDDVRLLCETLPYGYRMEKHHWTAYYSEEHSKLGTLYSEGWYRHAGGNFHVCNTTGASGIVTGIKCRGAYCDDISVECAQPTISYSSGASTVDVPGRLGNCKWSDWYSEEEGSVDFGWNRYVTGIRCRGKFCDDKQFHVCSLLRPAPGHL